MCGLCVEGERYVQHGERERERGGCSGALAYSVSAVRDR